MIDASPVTAPDNGTWRPVGDFPDHPSGRAADIMIDDYTSVGGRTLGDAVKDYLWANREYFQSPLGS